MSELWLSRFRLNPRNRAVQRDLSDCHHLHRRVMSGFPADAGLEARATFSVLYRPEVDPRSGIVTLIVQSGRAPDWRFPPDGVDHQPYLAVFSSESSTAEPKPIGHLYARIRDGQRLRFRLRANPTKRLAARSGDGSSDPLAGKRVGLLREDEQRDWLVRRLSDGGAALLHLDIRPDVALGNPQTGYRPAEGATARRGPKMTFQAVRFDGVLRVTDAEAFRALLLGGVGSGKAYGFGLLSVAPFKE